MMLTDNEIKKALEYCLEQGITSECERCRDKIGCRDTLLMNALDLINRRDADIERLERVISNIRRNRQVIESEAIKKFAERLKHMFWSLTECDILIRGRVDALVKELTEAALRKEDEGK